MSTTSFSTCLSTAFILSVTLFPSAALPSCSTLAAVTSKLEARLMSWDFSLHPFSVLDAMLLSSLVLSLLLPHLPCFLLPENFYHFYSWCESFFIHCAWNMVDFLYYFAFFLTVPLLFFLCSLLMELKFFQYCSPWTNSLISLLMVYFPFLCVFVLLWRLIWLRSHSNLYRVFLFAVVSL